MSDLIVFRKPMKYNGKKVDRGEVLPRGFVRGDESLYRQRWIEDLQKPEADLAQCGQCGRRFESYGQLTAHGDRAMHSERTGEVTDHVDPEFPRMKDPAPPTPMEEESGSFVARIDEVDHQTGARTVPAEYSQDEQVRATAKRKRGRPRKTDKS